MSLPKSTLSHCLSAPPGMSYTPISQTSGFEASTQASILVTGPDKPNSEGLRELDETIRTIKAYLSTRHYECSVELRVDQKSRHFRQATPVCRQDWCEIRLRQRRYPVHSRNAYFYPSKLEFSCRLCFSQLKSEILTTGEARHLSVATSSLHINDKIKGKGARRQEKKKKKNLIKLASVVRNPQTNSRHRTVILEAGFTQTYDIPVRDMKQWLLHSRDNVQLVVLADIKEDKKYILEQQKSDPSETMLLNF